MTHRRMPCIDVTCRLRDTSALSAFVITDVLRINVTLAYGFHRQDTTAPERLYPSPNEQLGYICGHLLRVASNCKTARDSVFILYAATTVQ